MSAHRTPPSKPIPETSSTTLLPTKKTRPNIDHIPHDLPDEPYLLSTPSDKPYALTTRESREAWRIRGLFEAREEHLQYQTFLWRETIDTVFELRAPHELENIRKQPLLGDAGSVKSGAVTPLQVPSATKKISLSDYKNKAKATGQDRTPARLLHTEVIGGEDQRHKPHNESEGTAAVNRIRRNSEKDTARAEVSISAALTEPVVHETIPAVSKPPSAPENGPVEITEPHHTMEGIRLPATSNRTKRNHDTFAASSNTASHNDSTEQQHAKKPRLAETNSKAGHSVQSQTARKLSDVPSVAINGAVLSARTSPSPPPDDNFPNFHIETPQWLPKNQGVATPVESPPELSNYDPDSSTLPDWIPGTARLYDKDILPPKLPKLPKWLTDLSARDIHAAVPATNGRSSEVSRQRSHSPPSSAPGDSNTNASKDIRRSTESQKRLPASAPPSNSEPKVAKEISRVQDDRHLSRDSSVPRKEQHNQVNSKVVRKAVKVNGGSSSFFETLKSQNQLSSPRLAATKENHPPSKLIVRLKYDKAYAKSIERLLRMKPMPRKEKHAHPDEPTPSLPKADNVITKHADLSRESLNKRDSPMEDMTKDEESMTSSKPPARNGTTGPRTPLMTAARSPVTNTPSSQRHIHTPQSDIKNTKVLASTPRDSHATPSTASSDRFPASSRSLSDYGAGGHTLQAWKSEYEKQLEIAKQLKRKMQATRKPRDSADDVSAKETALQGLESVLCFMLAFLALGQNDPTPKSQLRNWDSLLPLAREVCGACKAADSDHLHAISLYLHSACHAVVSSLHPRIKTEDYASFGGEKEFMKKVLSNLGSLTRLASAAEKGLPREVMKKEYTEAYEQCQGFAPGIMVKPMVAIRVCVRFLEVWTRREKIVWKSNVEEGICAVS